jgi:hypothetical protein
LLKLAMDELVILLAGLLVISLAGMLHDQIILSEAKTATLPAASGGGISPPGRIT